MSNLVSRVVRILAAAALLALSACETPPALGKEEARKAIEESSAFKGNWDPGMRFDGVPLERQPDWHREIVSVSGVEVRGTGVSAVARVGFTWKWNDGPLEDATYKGTAIFMHTMDGFRLQEAKLRNELWDKERKTE